MTTGDIQAGPYRSATFCSQLAADRDNGGDIDIAPPLSPYVSWLNSTRLAAPGSRSRATHIQDRSNDRRINFNENCGIFPMAAKCRGQQLHKYFASATASLTEKGSHELLLLI
jgi:hypothetical protein